MPTYIIHNDGVYNLYTSVAGGCYFVSGLTYEQLEQWYREEYGRSGMSDFQERLERTHKKGTSCRLSDNLREFLSCNRAGKNEAHVPYDEFIAQFLTIRPREPNDD